MAKSGGQRALVVASFQHRTHSQRAAAVDTGKGARPPSARPLLAHACSSSMEHQHVGQATSIDARPLSSIKKGATDGGWRAWCRSTS
jgi:hypothetical protein